ncbi:MAG TPA: DUF3667 domain-containing protein [Cyclobacteriaceae bacterium]|nr:DUF3667 domain-containing protein [Cyclobacteriaceae bacterium]HMV08848.1 DUF3667 domain-containing protein [Cyclobacteriaceae bacterium]HMV91209.1 DUF3667 domain-containing protein [Cyclobacteriaceae bacterium]HMW99994.1 DUF3667 domain-containing protein [Cyclobacteriaceae bacterium]HMX49143.1 DUF3667 domain-containing protein [Cyclobacteriaceae bacterium]
MTQTSTACKNCGATLTGNFCQNCGQKADIHKITIGHLLHEFFHALTHADKGILFLAKELLYRQGVVAAEYLDGKRKKYFNPLSFLVIATAIWALIVLKSGYFESMGTGGSYGRAYEMPKQLAFYFSESMKIILTYGKIISLIITVPLLSLLTWMLFRNGKRSYAENLVLQAFLIGEVHLALALIFVPAFLLFGHARMNNNIYQLVFLVYLAIAYRQFFKEHVVVTILKTIIVQVLFIAFFWLSIFAFVFVREQLFR